MLPFNWFIISLQEGSQGKTKNPERLAISSFFKTLHFADEPLFSIETFLRETIRKYQQLVIYICATSEVAQLAGPFQIPKICWEVFSVYMCVHIHTQHIPSKWILLLLSLALILSCSSTPQWNGAGVLTLFVTFTGDKMTWCTSFGSDWGLPAFPARPDLQKTAGSLAVKKPPCATRTAGLRSWSQKVPSHPLWTTSGTQLSSA